MTDEVKREELNASIESIISRGEAPSKGDEEVDALARLAAGLRGLPNPDFKARLRAELLPKTRRPVWPPSAKRFPGADAGWRRRMQESAGGLVEWVRRVPAQPWFRRNRPFAVAGGGYGLLAGACCTSGTIAHVLGLASAAAVSAFIQQALPYFVALSVAGLVTWLVARVMHEQGLTAKALVLAVRWHGLAMGGAWGAVFGASMGLAMVMGLY